MIIKKLTKNNFREVIEKCCIIDSYSSFEGLEMSHIHLRLFTKSYDGQRWDRTEFYWGHPADLSDEEYIEGFFARLFWFRKDAHSFNLENFGEKWKLKFTPGKSR